MSKASAFLAAQHDWALRQAGRLVPPQPFRPGMALPLAGSTLHLETGEGRRIVRIDDRLHVPADNGLFAHRVRRWLAAEARCLLDCETRALATAAGLGVHRVVVGDYRSRWGSCARDGRIAYSWRLILAPEAVRRAVVAHEVAHLAEPNHGPHFWALANSLLGEPHGPARNWLKSNGPWLHSFGDNS